MKIFNDNLAAYQRKTGYTDKELLEKTKLSNEDLSRLKSAKNCSEVQDILIKFCVRLEIDYSTLVSDSGFEICSIAKQYERCPDKFKSLITSAFFYSLDYKYGKSRVLDSMLLTSNQFTRRCSGKSLLTVELFNKLSSYFKYWELEYHLGIIMFLRIPNYNYLCAKSKLKFTLADIGDSLNLSTQTFAGRWTCINCRPIKSDLLPELSKYCTGQKNDDIINRFTTSILPSNYFCKDHIENNVEKGDMVNLMQFIDPPQDSINNAIQSDSKFACLRCNENSNIVRLTDEELLKIIKKLPENDKQEVVNSIMTKLIAVL